MNHLTYTTIYKGGITGAVQLSDAELGQLRDQWRGWADFAFEDYNDRPPSKIFAVDDLGCMVNLGELLEIHLQSDSDQE